MHPHHPPTLARALYRTFVLPSLHYNNTPSQHLPRNAAPLTRTPRPRNSPARSFATTPPLSAPREPTKRTEKWDEEITARHIYLVDPLTNKLAEEPRPRTEVLRNINRETHRLVQVAQPTDSQVQGGDFIPVCKIVDKKAAYDASKQRKEAAKDRKKIAAAASSVKTLELNWAIDFNDLEHRCGKMEQFLSEGRKVEIILAKKKAGRKANTEECEEVLRRIRKVVQGVDGAREARGMEGQVGGFATLFFQGRAPQVQKPAVADTAAPVPEATVSA